VPDQTTARAGDPIAEFLGVQVTPVGDVKTPAPTATMMLALPATPYRSPEAPDWDVHVVPSGDVTIVPASPTATNWLVVQATPLKRFIVFEVSGTHVTRSAEEMIVPLSPTAIAFVEDAATPFRWKTTPEFLVIHESPSEEVTIVPRAPTATA
jgi:hypothetical protein